MCPDGAARQRREIAQPWLRARAERVVLDAAVHVEEVAPPGPHRRGGRKHCNVCLAPIDAINIAVRTRQGVDHGARPRGRQVDGDGLRSCPGVRLVQAGEREAADIHKDLVAAVQQLIASVEALVGHGYVERNVDRCQLCAALAPPPKSATSPPKLQSS